MSDDEMPELEDLSEQLNEIRKARGIDEKNIPKDIKIGVVNEKTNNNKVNIPITTSSPPQVPVQVPKQQKQEEKPKPKQDNKRDEDNFGFGFFKRGFLKRHNFSEDENKNKKEKEPKKDSNKKRRTS